MMILNRKLVKIVRERVRVRLIINTIKRKMMRLQKERKILA